MVWVNFAEVKRVVRFPEVLAHYGIAFKEGWKDTIRSNCPLPSHTSKKSAQSFSVNVEKNVWVCQSNSCAGARGDKKGGNVLDFVAAMEHCTVRDAAVKLAEWFGVSGQVKTRPSLLEKPKTPLVPTADPAPEPPEANKPLGFQLKGVDPNQPYVLGRVKRETAEAFGVGYFPGKGTMAGRVVIPLHNAHGELVAYAGRWPGNPPAGTERYLLPKGFRKSLELWNLHRVEGSSVVVVEGFFDCMRVTEAGFPCVALMGCEMSEAQEQALAKFDRVTVFLDGDAPGKKASADITLRLAGTTLVRRVVAEGRQPDEMTTEEVKRLLA